MSSNHLILCHHLLILPSVFPSLFQLVGSLNQVAKVLNFSFSISPSNEYFGLISFSIDWFDLLVVQKTLKSLHQHHSSKFFNAINSSVLSLLYGPTLTSIPDYWKNQSFAYTDLSQQSDLFAY